MLKEERDVKFASALCLEWATTLRLNQVMQFGLGIVINNF
jgi:hypothetical protein